MATPAQPKAPTSIDPDTVVGPVALTVSDLARSRQFYERAIGLRASDRDDGTVALSGDDGHTLVQLRGRSAPALDRRATGLFHLAILLPTRLDLAFALARLAEARWPLDGRVRPPGQRGPVPVRSGRQRDRDLPRPPSRSVAASRRSARDGDAAARPRRSARRAPPSAELQRTAPAPTTIGHVHLQVADIPEAEAFYHGVLGFDVMVATLSRRAVRVGRRLSPSHRAEHLAQPGLGACGRRLGGLSALRRQPSRPGFAGRGARPGAGGRHPGACW